MKMPIALGTGSGSGIGTNPFDGSRVGNLGGVTPRPSGLSRTQQERPDQEHQERMAKFQALLDEFRERAEKWRVKASSQAWRWYQEDLARAHLAAEDYGKAALKVDFSVLQGRGPEFVLEFTAIVVIIFSAVILGVTKILQQDQIGTLLAAIAGYVLGKARSSSSSR
jgi:hypothetical protein